MAANIIGKDCQLDEQLDLASEKRLQMRHLVGHKIMLAQYVYEPCDDSHSQRWWHCFVHMAQFCTSSEPTPVHH